MRKNISPTNIQGKIVQLHSHDVILEIAPRGDGYDIEKVYTRTGVEVLKGEPLGPSLLDSHLYDQFYQEIDEGLYIEV
jgi:hypothetical protein